MQIECNEREAQALAFLIDAAVKSLGVRGAGDAIIWIQKLEAAMKETQNGTMESNSEALHPRGAVRATNGVGASGDQQGHGENVS